MEAAPVVPWFVAIGASGRDGLDDMRELLSELPSSLGAVVLIVLHRPWHRLSHLQSVLARASHMPVIIASRGEHFEHSNAYIGEPGDHLTLVSRSFGELINDPEGHYRNRTVDLLFRSVAAHGGERMIGVILSGSLGDGSRGISAIHYAGGLTMVLTPSALSRPGMPENAIAYDGPIDLIGDPRQIADAICKAVRNGSNRLSKGPQPSGKIP